MALKEVILELPIIRVLSSSQQLNVLASVTSVGLILVSYVVYNSITSSKPGSIRRLGGFPVFTAWTFFTKRYDFVRSNFSGSDPHFKFKVLHHDVVAFRGEEARKTFFDTKSLDFIEGYKILMGAAPSLKDIQVEENTQGDVSWFNKQIAILLNKNRLTDALPFLLNDVNNRMESWGKSARIDPFKHIYDLVFQMTVRMASCDELAKDVKTISELQSLYWTLEKSATPTALLLPWFPSPAKKRKEVATKELFMKLYGFVEARRHATVPSTDAIDVLLGQGMDTPNIVQFVLSVIFAGVINTGINSCWAIVYLASHPEWKAKVKAEINSLIEKHTNTVSTEPLHKRLAAIPISAWDDELPVLELVIRETLRLAISGTALRRNLIEELTIANGQVKKGDFVAYSLADVHLNPDIYEQPEKFDPSRFEAGREEDKKGTFSFLGWGAGRHPCSGMKIAKLEIKVIMAMMLAGFDFDIVDKNGKPLKELPQPDRNDIHQARPLGEPCFLQVERIAE
ncbi:Cytochrome P450 monooxygenase [Psilocybe cubensis]|uniref:Cytochrome P450 monooxygenase n=2 Tax=Psilocybe cubensis TaxID=181762 RepID=A0ACB8GQ24_PSICU|nr:Cytochrome P450 monooxygenase [Psilocybe cubensis]KAH9477139.1 Cytochrome P450 monooxygenase [Psilocybe cubensis]